jgi:hypothetical protein
MKPGLLRGLTHDYKCHRTTIFFADLSVLDGKVIDDCMPRHRGFIRFLKRIDTETRTDLELHPIVDSYGTHKHPHVKSLAETSSPLPLAFHSDIQVLAEPGLRLVSRSDPATHPTRQLPRRQGTGDR